MVLKNLIGWKQRVFSGGIWILWKDLFEVEIVGNHTQFIHFNIFNNNSLLTWMTTIYANPNPSIRRYLWNELANIALTVHGPWLLGSDFNTILYNYEKKEDLRRAQVLADFFSLGFILIACMTFISMGHTSLGLTATFFKRLDRIICNSDWAQNYAAAIVLHLSKFISDHRPLLVKENILPPRNLDSRPFRF